MTSKPTKSGNHKNVDLNAEIAELQVILRAMGEQAIMMRDGGKLAEKEKTYFGDIVTEADSLVEHKIVQYLQERHPDHRVRGEESGLVGPEESPYEWIVNPIDGTSNFSKGLNFFSIAVALLENGVPVLGIMHFPEMTRFLSAVKGGGVHDNGKLIEIFQRPQTQEMKRAVVATAISRRQKGRFAVLQAIRYEARNVLNTGSMTYNCALLAEHKLDAAIHTDATIFNIAAAIPILEEAGCIISGFEEPYPDLTKELIPVIFAENDALLADIKKKILPHWKEATK